MHHAYLVVGEIEAGTLRALTFIKKHLLLTKEGNPDVIMLTYGLLTVDDARRIIQIAGQAPVAGAKKALVITASRIYHEAQNALLKLFEEPPRSTTLFLVIPEVGQILPTLRSRVAILKEDGFAKLAINEAAEDFLQGSKEKRSAIIKKLTTTTDDEDRQESRDEAIALVNGIENAVFSEGGVGPKTAYFLQDIALLRGYLYDRSAPLKMILEHLSLTLPKGLSR